MLVADFLLLAGHGHVHSLMFQFQIQHFCCNFLLFLVQLMLHLAAHVVGQLAHNGTLLGTELTHLFQNGGQLTLFAEIPDAQRFERVHVHGFFDRLAGRFPQAFQHFLHGFLLY